VSADILSSSARLAEYFIEEKKPVTPPAATEDDMPPALESPKDQAEETKEATNNDSNDENKAIEDALKKSSYEDEGKKETLVDDLNAEIDGGEEDDEDTQFEHLEKTGAPRSRNSAVTEKKSSEGVKTALNLDKDNSDDEVRTIDLEVKASESSQPT
jgi:hypothetical protein